MFIVGQNDGPDKQNTIKYCSLVTLTVMIPSVFALLVVVICIKYILKVTFIQIKYVVLFYLEKYTFHENDGLHNPLLQFDSYILHINRSRPGLTVNNNFSLLKCSNLQNEI